MFQKAVRSTAKIKMAITGPSGAGKTFGALVIAKGLGAKKIAVVDTENGSASLYADRFDFDTAPIKPPYTTEKYMAAIDGAIAAGYDCIILDSISHAWAGEGGLLQQKEQLDSKGGNSYANWAKMSPKQEQFMTKILQAEIDLIATMRSKQDYVLADNGRGKMAPQKVGMAPIQREGAEYEFTTVFDVSMSHVAEASKDRTGLFDGVMVKLDENVGKSIRAWLNGAKAEDVKPVAIEAEEVAEQTIDDLRGECAALSNQLKDGDKKATWLEFILKAKTKKALSQSKEKIEAMIAAQGEK